MFTYEDGRPVRPDSARERFKRLAARAGLPEIRFYDLRHTYITGALAAGINPKVVSQRAGHADVTFTLKTYQHVLPGMDEDAAARAATHLLGATPSAASETTDPQNIPESAGSVFTGQI
ncbi:integrase [Nocardia transvalensis]|uniref:Integrase n=1 Tax=Nocardia transvalensis TaxID=37333 RepID=A0A7W9UGK4_9NOCA|nr:integrase [Nocardia transvalensis]